MAGKRSKSSGIGKLALGFVLGIIVAFAGGLAYLHFGALPVATADKPFMMEKRIVRLPLDARIRHEKKISPISSSEDAFEAGAHIYKQDCASCHGTPGHDVAFAKYMYPTAPQLWKKHGKRGVVGVSDDDPGETYWKVSNGIRLTGMPSYSHVLSDTQMWQVSLLLASADKELPDPVSQILAAP
jgi:thiosulfate dehydrogenase